MLELQQTLATTVVINAIKQQFARHGIPVVVHTDSGPQFFMPQEFRAFSRAWDFVDHTVSSPYHNGKVESAVKIKVQNHTWLI